MSRECCQTEWNSFLLSESTLFCGRFRCWQRPFVVRQQECCRTPRKVTLQKLFDWRRMLGLNRERVRCPVSDMFFQKSVFFFPALLHSGMKSDLVVLYTLKGKRKFSCFLLQLCVRAFNLKRDDSKTWSNRTSCKQSFSLVFVICICDRHFA